MDMHADQVEITLPLVRRLVDQQHPRWAGLPLSPLTEFGTDHQLFRLGDELVVRMPVYAGSASQAASDARWLPVLAPHLPVPVPAPAAAGEPDAGYPFPWSVVPWLPGANPTTEPVPSNADPHLLAGDLAGFIRALHAVDTTGGPLKAEGERGRPLSCWDDAVRSAIAESGDRIDADAVTAAWDDCVSAPEWSGPPVWIHGDLLPGNMLVDRGRLSGVIDFGALGVGLCQLFLQGADMCFMR